MKYLKEYKKINWNDWNDEEENYKLKDIREINYKDFKIGDKVICSFKKNSISYYEIDGIIYTNTSYLGIYFPYVNINGHNDIFLYDENTIPMNPEKSRCWNFSKIQNYSLKIAKI